jgi:hypothetical protein
MKLTQNHVRKLAEIIAVFLVNIIIFLTGKIFLDITIFQCFLFSLINSIWMPFLLLPLLAKYSIKQSKKRQSYQLEPLREYIESFRQRQQEIEEEIILEKKQIAELLKSHKFDWKLFRKILLRNGIKKLYHFTDEENIDSIISNGGLFSWDYCLKHNIEIRRPGGGQLSRQLDKRAGLENYVRLSFTPDHPMMYSAMQDGRITNPIILEINNEVIYLKDTLFSDKNAARKDANIGKTASDFKKIRFDILKSYNYLAASDEEKPYFQAEVLVKGKIELGQIKNVHKIKTTPRISVSGINGT